MMAFTGFDRAFLAFFKSLKANNTRGWFTEHKSQYQRDVEGPALAFIEDLAPRLKKVSPRFVADPRRVGGSLFRIYRDTRFSDDKTPYKTHAGIRFWHDGKGLDSRPSFYLHLSPEGCFGGGGIYHSDPVSLRKIRTRIDTAPQDWRKVRSSGFDIEGESLTRVPAGFLPEHPFAVDLKRKDHFAVEDYTPTELASAQFIDRYIETCERFAPLVKFLTGALGQRW